VIIDAIRHGKESSMPPPKPVAIASSTLDSRSRAYMIGHQVLSKQELQTALVDAETDPELKGSLRNLVIERYKIRIDGGTF
jgi:hypothetical protein